MFIAARPPRQRAAVGVSADRAKAYALELLRDECPDGFKVEYVYPDRESVILSEKSAAIKIMTDLTIACNCDMVVFAEDFQRDRFLKALHRNLITAGVWHEHVPGVKPDAEEE